MAKYNEILSPRFNRALQKLLGVKGPVPSPQIAGEIMPVLPIDIRHEIDPHLGWTRFHHNLTLTGAAGFVVNVRWRNPTGTNVIAIIESLIVSVQSTTAGDEFVISHGSSGADLATFPSMANTRFDNRSPILSPTLVSSDSVNQAAQAIGSSIAILEVPARSTYQLIQDAIQEIPVLPGDAIHVNDTTAAQTVNAAIIWRERFMEESERT